MSFSQFSSKVMPYIIAGVWLVIVLFAFIILSYVLLWGALIGLAIFGVVYLKNRFFPSQQKTRETVRTSKRQEAKKGRIIEHDDL